MLGSMRSNSPEFRHLTPEDRALTSALRPARWAEPTPDAAAQIVDPMPGVRAWWGMDRSPGIQISLSLPFALQTKPYSR